MTAQDLIETFCGFYGVTRADLNGLVGGRLLAMQEEFAAFTAEHGRGDEALQRFYAQSQALPYGLLHMALMELQGWAPWIRQHLEAAKARSVLDVGCGLGVCTGPLAAEGYGVVLADVPGRHLGLVADLYPEALVVPVEDLDGGFEADAVVCLEVLEHAADPEALLDRALGHRKPGGLFIASWSFAQGQGGWPLHLEENARFAGDAFDEVVRARGLGIAANRGDGLKVWK